MNMKLRYLLFVGLPFLVFGIFWFTAGLMHGQSNAEPRAMDFGDVVNFLIGGGSAAIIGAVVERFTRKTKEPGEPKPH